MEYSSIDETKLAELVGRLRGMDIESEEDAEKLFETFSKEMKGMGLNPEALVPNDSLRMFLLKVFNDGGNIPMALETILENRKEECILVLHPRQEPTLPEMEEEVLREERAGHFKAALAMQKKITEYYKKGKPGTAIMISGSC